MSELSRPPVASTPPSFTWARVDLDGPVAEVTLLAQGKASRQGPAFWLEAPRLFGWLSASPAVRVVILRGEGEGFSHGLDLLAMGEDLAGLAAPGAGAEERTALYELVLRMQEATSSIAACKKPVIAAIHGHCIGAGVDIVTACDVRLAAADARFSVREVRVAIVADMGSLARLPAIIGQGATRELALTGEDVGAERALELGLVSRVLPTREALLADARALAKRIADNPPIVVQGVKRVLNETSERAAAESLRHVAVWNAAFMPSEDLGEAMAAFVERRAPVFRGR